MAEEHPTITDITAISITSTQSYRNISSWEQVESLKPHSEKMQQLQKEVQHQKEIHQHPNSKYPVEHMSSCYLI